MTIRLAILAPTPALRTGLRALLAGDERVEVVGEGSSLSDLDELDGLDLLATCCQVEEVEEEVEE